MNKVSRQQFFVCFSRGKQGSVLKFLSMQLHIRLFLAAGGICGHPIRMKEKNEGKKIKNKYISIKSLMDPKY